MEQFFIILSCILIVLSVLPFVKNQHWIFLVSDFMKIHLFILQIIATAGLLLFSEKTISVWIILIIELALMIYHAILFIRFSTFYKKKSPHSMTGHEIKIISANIYQFNKDYERFIKTIQRENPDMFVTFESNADWERALRTLETDYPHQQKVTLENTYGMHFYAKTPFEKVTTHYFVADDIPSIEAHFKTDDGNDFVVFAVHPPPPSPTEEATSKERDGDLLSIAKRCKEINKPIIVLGDFNTVAWSGISTLFCKKSGLIDGRLGRGILASFHAKYWFFRVPLDLVFHSPFIFLKELKVMENIGSDHFPISCIFSVDATNGSQKDEVLTIDSEEKKETEELIEEGKKEESDNR